MSTPSFRLPWLVACLVPLLSGQAPANGFQSGDIVLYSPAIYGISSGSGAILAIDPSSGSVTSLLDIHGLAQSLPGAIAYDAFRDRLIFSAQLVLTDPIKLWLMDQSGALTDLGPVPGQYFDFTSGAGGKIYLRSTTGGPFGYLDAANVYHTLMDASGTAPFSPPSVSVEHMLYDAGTHALFMATRSGDPWSCGSNLNVNVHRVRLSNDGTRAVAIDGCTQVVVDPAGVNVPVGLVHGPQGQLLLTVDTNSNGALPRMSLIDPVTLAVTAYAWNSNAFSPATNAGTYCAVLDQAVILDSFVDTLLVFSQGESGVGTQLTASGTVSAPGSSGEIATLIEVPPTSCSAQIATYCTAKVSSSGCTPVVTTTGCPSFGAGSGFVVAASQVEQNKNGLYFYGLQGQAALPFQGGYLCVLPPTKRTTPTNSAGSVTCGGVLALDFNTWAASGTDPALGIGSVVRGQFWFRDPPDAISGTGLSGGVVFTLAP